MLTAPRRSVELPSSVKKVWSSPPVPVIGPPPSRSPRAGGARFHAYAPPAVIHVAPAGAQRPDAAPFDTDELHLWTHHAYGGKSLHKDYRMRSPRSPALARNMNLPNDRTPRTFKP